MIDRWYRALNSKKFRELATVLDEIADADLVQEWPHSGERIKGKGKVPAILENYPGLPDAMVGPRTVQKTRGY